MGNKILLSPHALKDAVSRVLTDISAIRHAVSEEQWALVSEEIVGFVKDLQVYEYDADEEMPAKPEESGFTIRIEDYILRKPKHIHVTWNSKISDAYKSVGIPVSSSTMICINGSCLMPDQFDMTWQDIRGFLQQFSEDADVLVYMVVDNHRLFPDTV